MPGDMTVEPGGPEYKGPEGPENKVTEGKGLGRKIKIGLQDAFKKVNQVFDKITLSKEKYIENKLIKGKYTSHKEVELENQMKVPKRLDSEEFSDTVLGDAAKTLAGIGEEFETGKMIGANVKSPEANSAPVEKAKVPEDSGPPTPPPLPAALKKAAVTEKTHTSELNEAVAAQRKKVVEATLKEIDLKEFDYSNKTKVQGLVNLIDEMDMDQVLKFLDDLKQVPKQEGGARKKGTPENNLTKVVGDKIYHRIRGILQAEIRNIDSAQNKELEAEAYENFKKQLGNIVPQKRINEGEKELKKQLGNIVPQKRINEGEEKFNKYAVAMKLTNLLDEENNLRNRVDLGDRPGLKTTPEPPAETKIESVPATPQAKNTPAADALINKLNAFNDNNESKKLNKSESDKLYEEYDRLNENEQKAVLEHFRGLKENNPNIVKKGDFFDFLGFYV